MNRLLLGLALLIAACGGNKSFESLCANQVPPPAACNTACDPSSAAGTASCPSNFHCAANGKCDTLCTPTGGECGNGYSCTNDGFCTSNGGNGDPPIDADCPAVHFTATKTTPSIQLLIDRSGSMNEDFSGRDPTKNGSGAMPPYKFPTEQDALVGTQGIVTQLQDSVYFGASMYPGATCTGVFQTPRAKSNATAIASLIAAHTPGGNTPTADAINSVVADFATNPPPQGSPPVIVLATDGLPNDCNGNKTNQPSIDAATNAFSKGIRLYLLSVGNQISTDFAKGVANAGQGVRTGQPDAKAYTATDPTQLAAAFQEIIRGVVSCDLKLSGQVDATDGQNGAVMLNGASLTYGTDWTLDADGVTIHLLGNACNTLKTTANPVVDATFSCGAVIF
jgi:von Willebrand factor type A domain-containing protein